MSQALHLVTFGATPAGAAFVVAAIALLLYMAYRWALPTPIPGIPYNIAAANRILGDIPEVMANLKQTGQITNWLPQQNVKFNSPISQVFFHPLGKPWVVVTDFRETQDICMRRTKEFDRSNLFGDIFAGLLPDHHISRKSHEKGFKMNRKLLQDLMTPAFLHQAAAPQIHSTVTTLLDMWHEKARLANGRPFSAASDIYNGAMDAIWAATFGLKQDDSTTYAQLQLLSSRQSIDLPTSMDAAADFPQAPHPPAFDAIFTQTESIGLIATSPVPVLHHWFLRQLPYMRKARAYKENMISTELDKAMKRFSGKSKDDEVARCAMDDIVKREIGLAKKENRAPQIKSRAIFDELFGFLIAGHDTTSTTITWGLKRLSDNPQVQSKLRAHLRIAYPAAVSEKRRPTASEIAKTQIPYLDAVLEEIVRMSLTTAGVVRVATVDTTILGRHIPKGTDVFMWGNGPDYFSAPIPVREEDRSDTSRAAKGRSKSWDPASMQTFDPERWMGEDDDGNEVYDPMAGPHIVFGLGPRGCFGKRLAYLELRIIIAMIVWEFDLLKLPDALSSYKAVDKMTRSAVQCFVRIADAS